MSSFPQGRRNRASESIGGAPDATAAGTVENVRINHGGLEILVAQKLLNRADIISVLDQVGREGVAERVAASGAAHTSIQDGLPDGPLDDRFVQVVAPLDL